MDIKEFRERLEELREEVTTKFSEFLKAENEMVIETKFSQNGFIDKAILNKVAVKKWEWQVASNNHINFIQFGQTSGLIKPVV